MNRCPSCHNLVPASWIACQRCGAALSVAQPVAPPRAGTITLERPVVAAVRRDTPARLAPAHDTLLPRTERDSLLPTQPSAGRPQMPSQRVALVSAGVLLALALIVLTIGHVRHASPSADAAANDPHARALLVDTTAAAHVLFVEHGSYMAVTPAALGRRMPAVPVVSASTAAGAGQVSVQVVNATTFIAATPATGGGCVFARAEPVKARVGFAATATGPCRAAGAPPQGWRGT